MSNENSPFLRAPDDACPPALLEMARSTAPRRIAFVRATGRATLETARDALNHAVAIPVLVGEITQIRADADAIGWNLDGVELIAAEGEQGARGDDVSGSHDSRCIPTPLFGPRSA